MIRLLLSRLLLLIFAAVLAVCAGMLAFYVFQAVLESFVPLFPREWRRTVFRLVTLIAQLFGGLAGVTVAVRVWRHRRIGS